MRLLAADEEDSEVSNGDVPASFAEDIDASEEARQIIAQLPRLDTGKYDRRKLHHAMQEDVDALTDIWYKIKGIGIGEDAKLQRLRELLATRSSRQESSDLHLLQGHGPLSAAWADRTEAQSWLAQIGSPRIRRVDGKVKPEDRVLSWSNLRLWPTTCPSSPAASARSTSWSPPMSSPKAKTCRTAAS